MTQKEAIRIAKEFGFQKITVLPEESGQSTFHYFVLKLKEKQIEFMLHNDCSFDDWGMTIELGDYIYYDYESCITILVGIINGQ
jgi:hypothetical protein